MRIFILGLVERVGHPVRRIVADRIPARTGPVRVGLATVTGRSMEPALHHGDQLVVLYGLEPRPGGLAVVRLPDGDDGPRPLSVKRVTGRAPGQPDHWWVERDNPNEGVDSWQIGPIHESDVAARVLLRVPTSPRQQAVGLVSGLSRVAARTGARLLRLGGRGIG